MTTDTKEEILFNVLKYYFVEKANPLPNIILIVTDAAHAMIEPCVDL